MAGGDAGPQVGNCCHFSRAASRRRRGSLVLASCLLLGLALPARAHPQFSPNGVNRYVKLVLQPALGGEPGARVRLAYTLMISGAPALLLRQDADQDRDGRLSPAETAAMGQRLLASVQSRLTVTLRERPQRLGFAAPVIGGGSAGDAPGLISDAPLALDADALLTDDGPPPYALTVEDRVDLPPVGEQEVVLDPAPGVRVERSYQGGAPSPQAAPTSPPLRFLQSGPPRSSLSDRSVTVVFSPALPAPEAAPPARLLVPLLSLAGLAALAAAALAFWRRRSR